MMYLSKGILPWAPSPSEVSVSHCGVLHKLAAPESALWLAGQFQPGHTKDNEQGAALWQLAGIGLVECGDTTDMASRFRLLANCAICPVRVKPSLFTLLRRDPREFILNSRERWAWKWIRLAGLRLTIAELTLLAERGVQPVPGLLGDENRQLLTETIYTPETIADGILESMMEKSPAMEETVQAVLGLLRKRRIFLM